MDKAKHDIVKEVSDKILEVANSYMKLTTSDLQSVADVEARKIIELVRSERS